MTPKNTNPIRALLLISILLYVSTAAMCGSESIATGFRIGFAASKPFVQSLVSSHTITQELADTATRDIDDGIGIAERTESCVRAAKPLPKPQSRVAQAKCYYQAAQDLRVILARHNLDQNEQLSRISTIASGAIEAFEAYYTSVNTGPAVTGPDGGITHTGADGISGVNADKELERTMRQLNQQLKDLQKGH